MGIIPLGRKPIQLSFDDLLSTKVCSQCKQEKPLLSFHKRSDSKDGRSPYCAECNSQRCKAHYRKNRAHIIASAREYVERNREKTKEYKRLHYLSKRGSYAQKGREYYETNKDWIRVRNRVYSQEHRDEAIQRAKRHVKKLQKFDPERYKVQALRGVHTRRARMAQVEGTITEEEWLALKERYDYTCLRCGKREPDCKLTLDHVIPISKGGTNTIDNAQPLCHPCNSGKGARHIDYRPPLHEKRG